MWRTDRHTLLPNDSTLRKNTPTSYFHYIRDVGNISKWKRMIKLHLRNLQRSSIEYEDLTFVTCSALLSLAPSPRKVSLCSSYLPGIPNLLPLLLECLNYRNIAPHTAFFRNWQFWTMYFTTTLLKIRKLKKELFHWVTLMNVCVSQCMYILGKQMHPTMLPL